MGLVETEVATSCPTSLEREGRVKEGMGMAVSIYAWCPGRRPRWVEGWVVLATVALATEDRAIELGTCSSSSSHRELGWALGWAAQGWEARGKEDREMETSPWPRPAELPPRASRKPATQYSAMMQP